MNRTRLTLLTLCFLMTPAFSLGCGFCSSKPKGLTSGGPAQDPGSASLSSGTGGSSSVSGQTIDRRNSGTSSFGYELKNYKPDGQRSNNEKWSSGDFFDNR